MCRMYVCVIFVVLFSLLVNAHTLTTFGTKTNNQNQQPQTPVVRGRECKDDNECAGQQYTSCVEDTDKKLRCLCGNNQAPINGQCTNKYKGIRHSCTDGSPCLEGGHCVPANNTNGGAALKICLCMEGYTEVDNTCSGSDPTGKYQGLLVLVLNAVITITTKLNL